MANAIRWLLVIALLLLVGFAPMPRASKQITVGSKKFTESVILGEVVKIMALDAGVSARHRAELGGTQLLFRDLLNGQLDCYPEYTGTLKEEILKNENPQNDDELNQLLAERGIHMSRPIGFENNYAIGMIRSRAEKLGIETISDLKKFPDLKFGFSSEFVDRADAWPGLQSTYNLPQSFVGLDHDLAYRRLISGEFDAIDVYTTDAKIKTLDIKPLVDDLSYFPRYDAVLLYRADFAKRFPRVADQLKKLEGAIDESKMIEMNEVAEKGEKNEEEIAAQFLDEKFSIVYEVEVPTLVERISQYTLDHIELVRRSLIPAILVAIPLGIIAANFSLLGQIVLAVTSIIQTVPALALLVLLMSLADTLGFLMSASTTAIMALFLYSLLPIVRNTYTGLHEIDRTYQESAIALGLNRFSRLVDIELPLAMRSILSGIKTAAVINIGFATLGALIGAGGYGQPIIRGLRLFNNGTMLEGAIPAAVMAVVAMLGFELLERKIVSPGLQLKAH